MSADRTFALKVRKIGSLLRRQLENLEQREVPAVSAWWGDLGIGSPTITGASMPNSNGTLTVQGSGTGYTSTSDQFHYRFKEMAGDGFITGKITSVTDTDGSAAGGLMIRGGYAANSPFAALTRNPNGGWSFQLRGAPGGLVSTATYAGPAANFAKLVRNGPLFSGYVSATGQDGTWSLVGTGSFAAGSTVSIGASVTALGSAGLASAVFENLTIADPPPIGAGLDGVIDWSYSNAFVDMTKQARQFMTAEGFQPVAVDANGWATTDHLIIFQSGSANQGHIYNGTYKLSFKGQATIDRWVSPATVSNVVYNASTNTTTADVTLTAPNADWYLGVVFRNTKRTPTSAVGTGVTDIKMIRPGYNAANYPTFTSQFTDSLKRFTTLRFMSWLETNNSHVVNWSDRTPGDYARQTKAGVSWENCVELANLLGKDLWINIPHQATNDYVTQVATYIKNNLRPDLAVYVEWSNEVWNWGFEQTGWNYNRAQAEVQAGSNLNFDGETNAGFLAWRRTAQRTKEVSDIFRSVWGAAAINTRVRVVLAGQSANPETFRQGLHYLNSVYGNASNYIYALAGAPYFSIGAADNTNNLTTDQVINALQAAQQAAPSTMQYAQCVAAAYANGLKFVAYEGGPDTFGSNNIQAKKQAMLDPRMKQIVDDYLTQWFDAGGGLFNWFVAGATSWDSPYGTWGLTNDMTNLNTPKAQGIDAVLARSTPLFDGGLSLPGEYSPRATVGSETATGNRYAGPGDKMQYLLRAPTDGQYTFKIRYATDVAGRSLRIAVNGQVVTTLNLPTTSTWDTFIDSAPVTLNLTNGPCVLEITVMGGGLQLGNLKFATGVTQSLISMSGTTLVAEVDAFNNVMPTGTVNFYDGATMVGSAPLDANGRASLNLSSTPSGNRIYKAVYTGTPTHNSSTSPGLSAAGSGSTTPPPPATAPSVQSFVINGGAAQRSSLRSLAVTFDKLVTLLSGAFELTLANGTAPTVNVTTTASNGRTVAFLTFSGAGVVNGSLPDGLYTLRIVANRVQDAANAALFMSADRVEQLHRLFGDLDGDRDVDSTDYALFRGALGTPNGANAAYDYDGDGDVDANDFRQFTLRYGRRL